VTLALALLVGSALLIASTDTLVTIPTPGAENSPPAVTVPFVADQVTSSFVVPDTVAVNCCLAPGARVTFAGLIATLIDEDRDRVRGRIVMVVLVLSSAVLAVINAVVTVVTIGA